MSKNRESSPITLIAILVSVVLIAALVWLMYLRPDERAQVAQGTGTPRTATATPVPTPTESPAPTPEPTPVPSPSPTPIPQIHLRGLVRTDSNEPGVADVYAVPRRGLRLPEAVRSGFLQQQVLTTKADDQGVFHLTLQGTESHYVGLLIGGEPQSFAQLVEATDGRQSDAPTSMTLTLPRPARVMGMVIDTERRGVSSVPVEVRWQTDSLLDRQPQWQTMEIRSNEGGRFAAEILEPRTVEVSIPTARLPEPFLFNGSPIRIAGSEFSASREKRIDLEVVRGHAVSGRVLRESDGSAMNEAEVRLQPPAIPGETASPMTQTVDANGQFHFRRVAPGRYRLSASAPGYVTENIFDYDPSRPDPVVLRLQRMGDLEVAVDTLGLGAGTTVTVSLQTRSGGEQRTIPVTAEDRLTTAGFSSISPGAYLLSAESTSSNGSIVYAERELNVTAGGMPELEPLKLEPLGLVEGRLLHVNEDLAALQLTARPLASGGGPERQWNYPEWRRVPSATIAGDGKFRVDHLPAGTPYLLLVANPQTGEKMGSAVTQAGRAAETLIALDGVGTISGRVSTDGNEGCENRLVEVVAGLSPRAGESQPPQTRSTRTRFDGSYEFQDLPVGSARVVLDGDQAGARLVSVPRNGVARIDVRCRVWVDIEFAIRGDNGTPFRATEQFLVLPKPGTVVRDPIVEVQYGNPRVQLEPGQYTITRTQTMESRSFEVGARLDGVIPVNFTENAQAQ